MVFEFFSIKNDAFTIESKDIENAKNLLNFILHLA